MEAVDWKRLFTFTGGEMEIGYEPESKWKEADGESNEENNWENEIKEERVEES